MSQDVVVSLVQQALFTIIIVAAPPLLIGVVVGVLVSIFQAVTSIQEPTLAFVPKILAVLLAIMFFGPFMLSTLRDFITNLFLSLPDLVVPR